MSEPLTATSNINYRTEFDSPSLGTEEELSGPFVRIREDAGQVIGVVRRADSPTVLVEITKDMKIKTDAPGYGHFTIELRTTPWEFDHLPGWEERTKALQAVVLSISESSAKPLKDKDVYAGFQTDIYNADHQITAGKVTRADRQATVGVDAAEIGASATPQDRRSGRLHPLIELPWYVDQFTADTAVGPLSQREKVGYALVMSAVLKLASIWHDHGENVVNNVNVKNAWLVRPRTPPIKILQSFSDNSFLIATTTIMSVHEPPQVPNMARPPADKWLAALIHIIKGLPMGGHNPPDVLVEGEPAVLFEYRTAPTGKYDHAFWVPGKWKLS